MEDQKYNQEDLDKMLTIAKTFIYISEDVTNKTLKELDDILLMNCQNSHFASMVQGFYKVIQTYDVRSYTDICLMLSNSAIYLKNPDLSHDEIRELAEEFYTNNPSEVKKVAFAATNLQMELYGVSAVGVTLH